MAVGRSAVPLQACLRACRRHDVHWKCVSDAKGAQACFLKAVQATGCAMDSVEFEICVETEALLNALRYLPAQLL